MVKTSCCEKTGLKKGAWTPEEDMKLVAYIQKYGHWNWRQLPKYAGLSRCGKSCRLRWMNYLRPNIKRGNYSREEEELIINLHQSLGNRWSTIAARLPGRTDNEIKNHWHATLKRRLKQNPMTSEANLERSPKSTQPSSSDFSSPSTDATIVTITNQVADENTISSEESAEPAGNFWTEPFLSGNSYIQDDFSENSVDMGLLFPLSPVSLGEPLYTYGSYNDDGIDLFN